MRALSQCYKARLQREVLPAGARPPSGGRYPTSGACPGRNRERAVLALHGRGGGDDERAPLALRRLTITGWVGVPPPSRPSPKRRRGGRGVLSAWSCCVVQLTTPPSPPTDERYHCSTHRWPSPPRRRTLAWPSSSPCASERFLWPPRSSPLDSFNETSFASHARMCAVVWPPQRHNNAHGHPRHTP